jgi:hypothetical protein
MSPSNERIAAQDRPNNSADAATSHELLFMLEEPSADLASIASRADVPPNGGYGWVCTCCVLMINAHTWGINSVSDELSRTAHTG